MDKNFVPVVTQVTQEEAENMMFGLDSIGYCRVCGAERSGCEPDARGYECYECGEHQVFGFEELMIMGEVEIVE